MVDPVEDEGNSQKVAIAEKADPAESLLACTIDSENESTCTQSTAILNTTGLESTQHVYILAS